MLSVAYTLWRERMDALDRLMLDRGVEARYVADLDEYLDTDEDEEPEPSNVIEISSWIESLNRGM